MTATVGAGCGVGVSGCTEVDGVNDLGGAGRRRWGAEEVVVSSWCGGLVQFSRAVAVVRGSGPCGGALCSSDASIRTHQAGRNCAGRSYVLQRGMKCSICHYVSPSDGPAHNARTCPLKQTQCRRSLREDHPFFEAGQCVSAGCVHKQKCNMCGITGHLFGTQALTTSRWKFNNKGRLVRKQTTQPLCKDDFVGTLMTEQSIRSMVDNSLSVSTAAAQDAYQRRVATSRLRANTNAECLDIDKTVRVMEVLGSEAAVLKKENKVGFKTLYRNAHLGAVAAGHLAASAVESSMDDATPPVSDREHEVDDLTTSSDDGEKRPVGPGASGKGKGRALSGFKQVDEMRAHRARRQSRTDRYASAVAKGQRRSPTRSSATKSRGTKGKAGKASIEEIIDVDTHTASRKAEARTRRWPLATRHRFEDPLPVFFSPRFGGTPPLKIAHGAAMELYQCPMAEVDPDMAGLIVRGAMSKEVRGYMLTSGTILAAQVVEWLCSAMPDALRSATLPRMAYAVEQMVEKQAAASAAASGVGQAGVADALGDGAAVVAQAAAGEGASAASGPPSAAAMAAHPVAAAASVGSIATRRGGAASDPPRASAAAPLSAPAATAVGEMLTGVAAPRVFPHGGL